MWRIDNMVLKLVVVLVTLTSASCTPVIGQDRNNPQVLTYEFDTGNMPNSYKFYYDASDGSSRTEQGSILAPGTPDEALDVLGTVRWYDEKGGLYQMTYKAGKRGYRTIIKKLS